MSDSVGKVQLDLETNYGPFQNQLNNIAGKSTNMVTAAFGKMGKAFAGAFAVTKVVQFGKACINLASDLDEVQNVVDVVFGQSAGMINNFAKNALTSFGLSELSAKRYSSTMGAMLKSMGLSQDAVLSMSQAITGLAGDMASFYNLDSDDAFNKIRSGISGETEPLKMLGINMSVANMEAFALSQGITKAYQKMTQSEQALLRYNYLLSVTADAQGDFARTSDSWANQTRILSEQFNSLKATLGSAFIAVLTPVVKMLNWIISKLQIAAAYFKAFVEALTGVKADSGGASSGLGAVADSANAAGEATDTAAKKAKKASQSLASFDKLNVLSSGGGDDSGSGGSGGGASVDLPSLTGLDTAFPEPETTGVEDAINKVKGFFEDFKEYLGTSFAPSISAWGGAFAGLKEPITESMSSISDSVSGFWNDTIVPFGTYLLVDFIPSVVNSFSETFAPIFTDTMSFAFSEFAKDFEFATGVISSLVNDILTPAFTTIEKVFTDVMSAVKTEWDNSGKKLLDLFGKVRDTIKEIWNNLYETILKPVWQSIVNAIDTLWENHLKGLWESVLSFASTLGEAVMTVWNNFLAPLINWIISVFGPHFVDMFNSVKDNVVRVIGNMIDAAKNILDALKGLLNFVIGVFSGDWERAWNGIKSFFENLWKGIVNVVKAPINSIIGYINTMIAGIVSGVNTAIRALNKLSFTIPSWVPGIGGNKWGFNISQLTAPKIPMLAEGGIIDQPTLAMVGERGKEAVVPLENTAFADAIANAIFKVLAPLLIKNGGISSNSDGNIVVVLKVGEYELGRVSVGAINKYHNVVGKVELEV